MLRTKGQKEGMEGRIVSFPSVCCPKLSGWYLRWRISCPELPGSPAHPTHPTPALILLMVLVLNLLSLARATRSRGHASGPRLRLLLTTAYAEVLENHKG